MSLALVAELLPFTSFVGLAVVGSYLSHASYRSYISHGPGGLGQHWRGWVTSALFRLVITIAGKEIHSTDVTFLKEAIRNGEKDRWLRDEDVPMREGLAPIMLPFPIPQRHVVESENAALATAQLGLFTELVAKFPAQLRFGCSQLEHDGPAIYARAPPSPSSLAPLSELMHIHLSPFKFASGKAHVHIPNACCPNPSAEEKDTYMPLPSPAAQSIHITLSPRDACLAIERGWALRHPASGQPPRPIPPLPKGMVLVFAPRDEQELEMMRKFCEASVAYGARTVAPLGDDE